MSSDHWLRFSTKRLSIEYGLENKMARDVAYFWINSTQSHCYTLFVCKVLTVRTIDILSIVSIDTLWLQRQPSNAFHRKLGTCHNPWEVYVVIAIAHLYHIINQITDLAVCFERSDSFELDHFHQYFHLIFCLKLNNDTVSDASVLEYAAIH